MNKSLNINELKERLINLPGNEFLEFIEDIHPADILDVIRESEEEKAYLIKKLPHWLLADVIEEMEEEEKEEFLNLFTDIEQGNIVNEMSSDEITDLLLSVEPDKANKLLEALDKEDQEEVKELLTYQEDTAGGLMATEFIAIKENMTVAETLTYLQTAGIEAETVYYLYVLDEEESLKGILSLRELVISSFDIIIRDIMHENVKSIPVFMDQEDVAVIFEKYGFQAMPVVGDKGDMLGVITLDDIIEVVRDEDNEDIYRLGGLNEGEVLDGRARESVKSRLPWLFVNLITAILAGATVNIFNGTIDRVVILASFMPIVAGMGGNAGTQSLTLIVRGIALGELTGENARRVFFKEVLTGLVNGAAIGVAVSMLGVLWSGNPIFGLVVGIAMILNMALATIVGYAVPVVLKKVGVDPALASAVFVTTFTDVCGFFFFLGLATLFISKLT
ncbi:magnesium transporter [Clostridium sp. 'White wine YQ']|uniref:magnesium transporter n=1 Tax=Clostridium sp. 'White wine YQ' TaxID=3027474 RepID=UPI002366603A|nr:magnesium transporter [Clostridium sp. 'White wine YQ']MDD7796253.1 magnesium transporter [Clostridium sp. 'White wine YQ']